MTKVSAVALFCEDIRQEASGMITMVGLLADILHVPAVPGIMPKLGLYVRAVMPVETQPMHASIFLEVPGQGRVGAGEFSAEVIAQAMSQAKANGLPVGGIFSYLVASPFQVNEEGVISAHMEFAGEKFYLGNLKVEVNRSAFTDQEVKDLGHLDI